MARADPAETLRVEVAFSPASREVELSALTLPAGSTVAQALQASGLQQRHPRLDVAALRVGVWGRPAQPGDALRDGDRVEVYRPLQVDPKEARRLRYRSQTPRKRHA